MLHKALGPSLSTHFLLFHYRNGVPVRPDGHSILLSSDGSLILNNVKPSDEGTYTCNAYTGIYSVSATAEVRVMKDTQQGESDECKLLFRSNRSEMHQKKIVLLLPTAVVFLIDRWAATHRSQTNHFQADL